MSARVMMTEQAEVAAGFMQMAPADQTALLRLMRLVSEANRAARDQAMRMLMAQPEAVTQAEIRARHETVCRYLEEHARQ